jgi:phospholipid/cholesterol/gamma-HCH transport system permease protein
MAEWLGLIGQRSSLFLSHVASISRLTVQTVYWSLIAPFYRKAYNPREVFLQMDRAGVQSFYIISLVCFLIGLILVLQTAYMAESYGQLDLVPGAVAVSLTREIGPLITAVVVTGRVGAAFAAELGAQKVSNEIMALQCMAINPIGFLIAPRFIALVVMLPILTIFGVAMGLFGGYMLGTFYYGIAGQAYIESTFDLMKNKDVLSGIVKSFVFAIVICMVGCYKGFTVSGGSVGVGKATMEAVVTSIVLIIAADAVFTALMIVYWP